MGCISSVYAVKHVLRHILTQQYVINMQCVTQNQRLCWIEQQCAAAASQYCYRRCSRQSIYHGMGKAEISIPSLQEDVKTEAGEMHIHCETEQTLVASFNEVPSTFFIGIRGTRLIDTDDLIMDIHIMNGDLRTSSYFTKLVQVVRAHMQMIKESTPHAQFILTGHSLGGTGAYLLLDALPREQYNQIRSMHAFNPGVSFDPDVLEELKVRGSKRSRCPRFIHHVKGDLLSSRFMHYPHCVMIEYQPTLQYSWDIRFLCWVYGTAHVFPFLKQVPFLRRLTLNDVVATIQCHNMNNFVRCPPPIVIRQHQRLSTLMKTTIPSHIVDALDETPM